MKLLRYESGGRRSVSAFVNDENILQLGNSDISELMPDGAEALRSGMVDSLPNLRILPPLMPGKILGDWAQLCRAREGIEQRSTD